MIAKIAGNRPQLIVSSPYYLGNNNKMIWRFDNEKPNSDNWELADSRRSLIYLENDNNLFKPFIKSLLKSDQVTFKINPYKKKQNTIIFKLDGIIEVLEPHLEELGWEELKPIIVEERNKFTPNMKY